MKKPLILINFKTYKEAVGKEALKVAKSLAKVRKPKYKIAVAPSLLEIKDVVDKTNLMVISQHTDHVGLGANTGRISAKELRMIGVKGTLLNHSERKIPMKFLREIVPICKKEKLVTIVCASSMSEVKKIIELKPDYIAYEPAELIGGDVSVTKSQPDIIVKVVELVKGTKIGMLVGAGVHSKEDVGQALLLGAKGVLIGHAVPKAKNPGKFLADLLM